MQNKFRWSQKKKEAGAMKKIKVKIICPECLSVQKAIEEQAIPFWIYIHQCTNCGYIIMESEWERI